MSSRTKSIDHSFYLSVDSYPSYVLGTTTSRLIRWMINTEIRVVLDLREMKNKHSSFHFAGLGWYAYEILFPALKLVSWMLLAGNPIFDPPETALFNSHTLQILRDERDNAEEVGYVSSFTAWDVSDMSPPRRILVF